MNHASQRLNGISCFKSDQRIIFANSSKAWKQLLIFLITVLFVLPLRTFEKAQNFDPEDLPKPKIGLVLSGGGAKGFAHIGMLKYFDEIGLQVDYIVGTSMGAIIGGLYASGISALEIEEFFLQVDFPTLIDDRITRQELAVGQKRWLPTGNFYLGIDNHYHIDIPQGLAYANKLHLELFRILWRTSPIDDFDQLPIPFRCIATDLVNGDLVVLKSGSLADALLASSTIPSVLAPVEINGKLLVDGGLTQNLPADIAKQLGANFIIGLKTNTELLTKDELINPLMIITQVINIGQQFREKFASEHIDLLLKPPLENFSSFDYRNISLLIDLGYQEALRNSDILIKLVNKTEEDDLSLPELSQIDDARLPEKIKFSQIKVLNQLYLSSFVIRDYLGLKTNVEYDRNDLDQAFKRAYSTELFTKIYPHIQKNGDEYHLIVLVQERERRKLGLNISYNQLDNLTFSALINMRNVLLNNSNLWLNFQAGEKNALEADYTKYFVSKSTLYYRIFPYIRRDLIYLYDEHYQNTEIHSDLESGLTLGIGIHPLKNTMIESFAYHYQKAFDKHTSVNYLYDKSLKSSGIGIKLLYENLNAYPYYTKGQRFFVKYDTAKEGVFSDLGYAKMISTLEIAHPIYPKISILSSVKYGTYFDNHPVQEDPFYLGGLDNFLGLKPRELSAPIYRIFNLGIRLNPLSSFYIDFNINYLSYGNYDILLVMDKTLLASGMIIGYDSFFGPIRAGVGINENSRTIGYVSVGYDYDAFFFSRR